MARRHLRASLEILGALSIVASLLFLAVQVRQENRLARATAAFELVTSWNEWHVLVISDTHTADLVTRLFDPDPELTPAEQAQAASLANWLFNTWWSTSTAYENGLIDEATYLSLSQDVPRAMQLQALLPVWRNLVQTYPAASDAEIFAPLTAR